MSGVKALADALSVNASLMSLSLGFNLMGDEGVTAICEAVQSNKEMKLATLDIQSNCVGPAGAKSVAAMVAVIPSMTQVMPNYSQIRKHNGWRPQAHSTQTPHGSWMCLTTILMTLLRLS